jgi:hypothetical protein
MIFGLRKISFNVVVSGVFLLTFFCLPVPSLAAPHTANYYLGELQNSSTFISQISRYDVLILTPAQIATHQSVISAIRTKKPAIIILAYVPSQSYNTQHWTTDPVFKKLQVKSEWYIRSAEGAVVSAWPGLQNIDMQSAWTDYFIGFVQNNIANLPGVDGIFFDIVSENISWLNNGNIDLDKNGQKDNPAQVDAQWLSRTKYFFEQASVRLNTKYIVMNGTSHASIQPYTNGRMFETFPTPWEGDGSWQTVMNNLKTIKTKSKKPALFIINSNTNNGGNNGDYRTVRFGLTSALLEGAYFSFDHGDQNHGQLWWYDEYDVDLGIASGASVSKNNYTNYAPDVWSRQFQNGMSLVNSTNQAQSLQLSGDYEKIHGTQDTKINDGSIISEVNIAPQDGILLLRTFETLQNIIFTNGAFARFFRPDGSRVRNGFFVFEEAYKGGYQIAHIDLDGNDKPELLVFTDTKMEAWRDDGIKYLRVYPFTANYTGKLHIAIGDIDENGRKEIFVAPSKGQKGPIKIYNRYGNMLHQDFYPFGKDYSGGYSLAVGDVDGRLDTELIVGRGGDKTEVVVFDKNYKARYTWKPFESNFLGGANVAVGKVDGGYINQIIVGRREGKPDIKVFNANGTLLYKQFSAYESFGNPGIDVRALDVDFDGKDDIVGLSEDAF